MSDAEERLLRELLYDAYRDINPDLSAFGAHLVRKLAEGMYARGARIQIGAAPAPRVELIHHSTGPELALVWTDKNWREVMGYRQTEVIGQPVVNFLAPDSRNFFLDFLWPAVSRRFETVQGVTLSLMTAAGQILTARFKSEPLRDPTGAFVRTFSKIKVTLAILGALACGAPKWSPRPPVLPAAIGHVMPMVLLRLRPVHHVSPPSAEQRFHQRVIRQRTARPGSRRGFFG